MSHSSSSSFTKTLSELTGMVGLGGGQTGGKGARKAKGEYVHYTVVKGNGSEDGDFKSKNGPAAAARKAARPLFTASNTKVRITIREKGSKRTFTYDVTRVKLPKPFVQTIAGRKITREYTTTIKAVK